MIAGASPCGQMTGRRHAPWKGPAHSTVQCAESATGERGDAEAVECETETRNARMHAPATARPNPCSMTSSDDDRREESARRAGLIADAPSLYRRHWLWFPLPQ